MASVQIPNLGAVVGLDGSELMEVVQGGVSKRVTTAQIAALGGGSGGGAAVWGGITGTLSAQTDLQTALNAKGGLAAVNIWSQLQTFFTSGGSTRVGIDNSTGNSRFASFKFNGLTRWEIGNSGSDTEGGGNTGSNLNTNRYDDSGTFIDTTSTVNRATGITTFKQLALTAPLGVAQGGTNAITAIAAARSLSVPYIFKQSGATVTVGAVTTEVVLATISFTGGEMGPNGWVIVTTNFTNNNNANFKQLNVRVGGVGGVLFQNVFLSTNTALNRDVQIVNNNSQSAQKTVIPPTGFSSNGASGASITTATVNTAAAWDIVISGQKAVAGDTLTLEGYTVLVFYGA